MNKLNPASFLYAFHAQSGEEGWLRSLYFLLILVGLILCEIFFFTLFSGYMPTQMNFLLWDNIEFLLVYFSNEPLNTLKFVFMDKPLFVIESRLQTPSTVVWGLHYYSYTVVIHIVTAMLLTQLVKPFKSTRPGPCYFLIIGSALLIFSSLYLYLSSCCTGEANWILHTWLLAVVFNPITATESIIALYQLVHNWFGGMQVLITVLGVYFIFKWYKAK